MVFGVVNHIYEKHKDDYWIVKPYESPPEPPGTILPFVKKF